MGGKVNLTARVKGGSKPYNISWQGGAGSGATFIFAPKGPGQHRITATVSDSNNLTAQAAMIIEANDKPRAPKELKVRLQLSGPIEYGPKGQSVPMVLVHRLVTVRAKVSGGSGKYKFEWSGDRGWRPDEDPKMVTYVSRMPGRANLSVQVIDEKTHQRGSAQLELQVYGVVVKITGRTPVSIGPPSQNNPPNKFTVSIPPGGNGLTGSPLNGKPLYLLLQPHPEVRWCNNPQSVNCEEINNCMDFEVNPFSGSHSATAVFCESGTTAVWAEVYAVDGPQKILVGDAYLDVEVR